MKSKDFFDDYIYTFLEKNSRLNLISKNDEKYLWEKHIYDSLSLENFFDKYGTNFKTMLDIGTGGGFPAVPVALAFPNLKVFALDSIRKKINAVESIKADLKIENLNTICDRAENVKQKFDLITSRAVAPLKVIASYAAPLLKSGGYFVAYKSRRVDEEITDAQKSLKSFNLKIIDIIEYELPLDENYTRNLVVLKKM